jgi:hypothetical protein
MRELVRTSRYVMTVHGHEEMEADRLSVFDVEHCILTGEIIERQKDHRSGEWKYLVEGRTLNGDQAIVVSKIGPTGKIVVLTVYLVGR